MEISACHMGPCGSGRTLYFSYYEFGHNCRSVLFVVKFCQSPVSVVAAVWKDRPVSHDSHTHQVASSLSVLFCCSFYDNNIVKQQQQHSQE